MTTSEALLPWPPSVLSPNARTHWFAKAKAAKLYRKDCGWRAKAAGLVVTWDGPIYVVVTFYPPDHRHRDLDNCIASLKSALDGVADALGINDTRFRIEAKLTPFEVVKGGAVSVRISSESA